MIARMSHPEVAWLFVFRDPPPWQFLLFLPLYVLSLCLWPHDRTRVWSRALSSLILFGLYLSIRIGQYGDLTWTEISAVTGPDSPVAGLMSTLLSSSLLAQLTYVVMVLLHLPTTVLAPASGVACAFVFFKTIDTFFFYKEEHASKSWQPSLGAFLYLGSGLHWLFFFGFLEVSFLSTPFFLLFLLFGIRYLRSDEHESRSQLLLSALSLSFACLIHGQNTFLLPALPALVLLRQWGHGWRPISREVFFALGAAAALVVIVVLILMLAGFTIVVGDSNGGPGGPFVPLTIDKPTEYNWYPFFSFTHFVFVENILELLVPLSITIPFIVGLRWFRRESWSLSETFLCITSLGYFAFIVLWNFDLGFPRDVDLMLSMGVPLLLMIWILLRRLPLWMGLIIGAVNIFLAWGVIAFAVGS